MKNNIILLRDLGRKHWLDTFYRMHFFTKNRDFNTVDEIWFVEHYPIFTHGQIPKKENVIFSHNIPIVQSDRGGQITYHGPGQQVIYFLINIRRRKMGIRHLINIMQDVVKDTLNNFLIYAYTQKKLPGVYVKNKKISSIGLRITNGHTLHGLSLNIDMDLIPFNYIYPCGDRDVKMTQIKDLNCQITVEDVKILLIKQLSYHFQAEIVNIQ
ncbi:lipoyl(octanoyl) transferase LipB [Buchnera aphidicola]|uniref:lipoyl(octanoyl) transferase LipB n=1 Tax=Buchnera aphidicola TaxID=9 RepID=UPI0034644735